MNEIRSPKTVNNKIPKEHIWCSCLECNTVRENFNTFYTRLKKQNNHSGDAKEKE